MKLYDYQKRVARHLRAGTSVILQAPTGAGKTLAALWPYLETWDREQPSLFPRKCIYSVPMRVLANQFEHEVRRLTEEELLLAEQPRVVVQTGERPEDRELEGDLIFTTIDQTLSNFLNVPYALGSRKANVNAGAVVAAYLVFDEFHLFPHENGKGALSATIQMLRLLSHTTPFVLMTATFSAEMLAALADQLGATVVVVPPKELDEIDTRQGEGQPRRRRFHLRREQELGPGEVLKCHVGRSLVVCNTVDRVTALYNGLLLADCRSVPFNAPSLREHYEAIAAARAPDKQAAVDAALNQLRQLMQSQDDWKDTRWILLLHARFEQSHRAVKEEFARQMFGPVEKRPWPLPSLLLAATQVIEVGLNLTGENLHTEIAPANSVLQRAGRCARFPGESGDVYVYAVPTDKKGKPNYRPYPPDLCKGTWQALAEWDREIVDFTAEQSIINAAHGEHDRDMLQKMREVEGELWQRMEDAVVERDVSARKELIRNVNSRAVLVFEPPEGPTEENPYRMKGFSLYHGTLRGKFEVLQAWAKELNLDWCLKYPQPRGEEDDSRAPTAYLWLPVEHPDDVGASLVFAVHPALAAYDAERGFRFVSPASDKGGRYVTSPPQERGPAGRPAYTYELESYPDHIRKMIQLYERDLRDSLAYVARRMEEHPELRLPSGGLDRAVRLAIALHDVGKLQATWQQWARNYQQAIGAEVPDYLVAHTRSQTEEHRETAKMVKPKRPNHAGEGAMASAKILGKGIGGGLARAALTAIARHHSPQLRFKDGKGFKLHSQAQASVGAALRAAGCDETLARHLPPGLGAPLPDKYLLGAGQRAWWLVYFLIVRMVRLTDGRSQGQKEVH